MYSGNLNQVGVHTGILVSALPAPYSSVTQTKTFSITVVDPCLSAVISGTVPSANVAVFAPLGTYSAFTAFTYTSLIGSTACGTLGYIATEATSASVSSLSNFALAS